MGRQTADLDPAKSQSIVIWEFDDYRRFQVDYTICTIPVVGTTPKAGMPNGKMAKCSYEYKFLLFFFYVRLSEKYGHRHKYN